ncbi:MAG: biopolymer transport protein ExbD [Gammaproteobacteria bacterium]|nr:MAG: biopolymer transporter ExbD [Pseudomonadota bacterium]MBC6943981.1 biopolymer transporter ExbD [Gammaproteobacteria bacterium]MCE7895215.1 biopolymer transporter ExbD [Gammaproteobacteria bacterium PRO8]MDL1880299.1 biopolymer transporter ExbD [Gammaproteobacteria bacterium PRO2]MCL4776079.1 biopolymer transporter ExbD [Gammaproteobacteria bacterium]
MGMSVPGEGGGDDKAMSDINVVPLVDIMLVLLIIFLITIPVITQTVPVELPKVANQPTKTKPENVTVAVNATGDVFWNQSRVPDDQALLELVKSVAVQDPQPEIHIRGDGRAKFESVGRVIYLIQRGGVVKVGFITEPDRGLR